MHMFFSDRNECVIDNGGCEQTCQNTVGSRYCLCTQDYVAVGNVCFGKCMIRPLFSFCSCIIIPKYRMNWVKLCIRIINLYTCISCIYRHISDVISIIKRYESIFKLFFISDWCGTYSNSNAI